MDKLNLIYYRNVEGAMSTCVLGHSVRLHAVSGKLLTGTVYIVMNKAVTGAKKCPTFVKMRVE